MSDNLPAVPAASREVARTDTDSWIDVVGDVASLASKIAGTEFVPRNLRGNIAGTAAAILYGREVGLPPMTTLTQTHVIEGKPAMSAEAMRAMVLAAGHTIHVAETTGVRCVMRGRRSGADEWTEIVWTLDMAKAAGVANKAVWKQYPRQMLQARATTELVRLVFPDVIHGFRSVEEFDQLEGAVVEDSDGNTAPAAAPTKVTRRRTAKKAAAPAPVQAPVESAADMDGPPLPGDEAPSEAPAPVDQSSAGGDEVGEASEPPAGDDQDVVDAEVVEDEPPFEEPPVVDEEPRAEVDPEPKPGPSTRAQHRMLFSRLSSFGIDGDGERLAYTSALIGRDIESFNGMSKQEASTLIETLAMVGSREDLDALVDAAEERRS